MAPQSMRLIVLDPTLCPSPFNSRFERTSYLASFLGTRSPSAAPSSLLAVAATPSSFTTTASVVAVAVTMPSSLATSQDSVPISAGACLLHRTQ